MDKITYEMKINEKEKIIFSICEYENKKYIDLRKFLTWDNGKSWRATVKGISIPIELSDKFIEGLKTIERQIL